MKRKDKEEERIERIIRGLLKLPENRRCINCNSLGPQYVCTTFNTFVCTNCSGIQEFTHRVKSVSMAKFNPEEVSALQAGGNERARQIYFKGWDDRRNSYPDGSNLQRLRDFIKHVYVDRKYTRERSHDNLPRLRMTDKEELHESRKVVVYRGGSRSPNYEERYEQSERFGSGRRSDDKTIKYYYDERRSPRYAQENSRYGGLKKSPTRFEVVDDRIRDDGIRAGIRQSDNRKFSHRESRYDSRSSEQSSPVIRPVKDIMGENVPALQVGEFSKTTDRGGAEGSAHDQMNKSSVNVATTNSNQVKQKSQSSESLIDLSSDSKLSNATAVPQAQEFHPSNGRDNTSPDESIVKESKPPAPRPNTLEFLLFELSVPVSAPAANVTEVRSNDIPSSTASSGVVSTVVPPRQMSPLLDNDCASTTSFGSNMHPDNVSGGNNMLVLANSPSGSDGQVSTSNSGSASTNASRGNIPVDGILPNVTSGQTLSLLDSFDAATTPANDFSSEPTMKVPHELQPSSMQQYQHSTGQQATTATVGALNNQLLTSSQDIPTSQGSCASGEITVQDAANLESSSGVTKSRKELPEDLFTLSFSSTPGQLPHWQTGPTYGMGFNPQYYSNAMHVLAPPHQAKSTNPFDTANPVQVHSFPYPGNLQGALANVSTPSVLSQSSSFGRNPSGLKMTAQSPSYASALATPSPTFASMSSGAYMGQQEHMNIPHSRPEGASGYGSDPFSSLAMTPNPFGGYSLPTSARSLPSNGGNPFS